jgi:hypothetical protein
VAAAALARGKGEQWRGSARARRQRRAGFIARAPSFDAKGARRVGDRTARQPRRLAQRGQRGVRHRRSARGREGPTHVRSEETRMKVDQTMLVPRGFGGRVGSDAEAGEARCAQRSNVGQGTGAPTTL